MITLRRVTARDHAFLMELYASTRTEGLGWLPSELLEMQFSAQDTHYRQTYPGARRSIVQVNGIDAGRLSTWRGEREVRVIDISLMPGFRGHGIGTLLLTEVMAGSDGCDVTLHVDPFSRARALYERLGFTVAEDGGGTLSMVWTPRTEALSWTLPS